MDPFSIAALGLGAFKAGFDIFGGFGKADLIREQSAEEIRRFKFASDRKLSETKALGMASGITADSASLTTYLDTMSNEFRRQTDWMAKAADKGATAAELSGIFAGGSDLGSSIFTFGQANNWFRSPSVK